MHPTPLAPTAVPLAPVRPHPASWSPGVLVQVRVLVQGHGLFWIPGYSHTTISEIIHTWDQNTWHLRHLAPGQPRMLYKGYIAFADWSLSSVITEGLYFDGSAYITCDHLLLHFVEPWIQLSLHSMDGSKLMEVTLGCYDPFYWLRQNVSRYLDLDMHDFDIAIGIHMIPQEAYMYQVERSVRGRIGHSGCSHLTGTVIRQGVLV